MALSSHGTSPCVRGGTGMPESKSSLLEISWKSAFLRSNISSNAARCELTNVNVQGRDAPPPADGGEYVSLTAVAPLLPFNTFSIIRQEERSGSEAHHHAHDPCANRCGSNVPEALSKPLPDDDDQQHANELLRRKLMSNVRQRTDLCRANFDKSTAGVEKSLGQAGTIISSGTQFYAPFRKAQPYPQGLQKRLRTTRLLAQFSLNRAVPQRTGRAPEKLRQRNPNRRDSPRRWSCRLLGRLSRN